MLNVLDNTLSNNVEIIQVIYLLYMASSVFCTTGFISVYKGEKPGKCRNWPNKELPDLCVERQIHTRYSAEVPSFSHFSACTDKKQLQYLCGGESMSSAT